MATKIRLARFGRKKRPFYRIVVADSRSPRDGRHLERIGDYDPLAEPAKVNVNRERVLYWLNNGAIPTHTTKNLLSNEGVMLEWDLRKSGKSEDTVKEELQKFEFLREQKLKKLDEKKEAAKAEKAVPAESVKDAPEETKAEKIETEDIKAEETSEKEPPAQVEVETAEKTDDSSENDDEKETDTAEEAEKAEEASD